MGPLSYMRSVIDRNVVMRRIPVYVFRPSFLSAFYNNNNNNNNNSIQQCYRRLDA